MIDLNKIIELVGITSPNDLLFLKRIFSIGITPYIERVKQYKFFDYDKVLDAGCGFGQWSLALCQLNKEVYSCDAAIERVEFLKELTVEKNISNIQARQAFIDDLPYDNEYFDAIFCYGVIFVTPWKKSLSELIRVLKPGGKLYVSANGLGWYKHLWYSDHNRTEDYIPSKVAAEAWLNTYYYKEGKPMNFPAQLIIEPSELISTMKSLGMQDTALDGEGLLYNTQNQHVFFQKEYFGDIGVYEVLGTKK